MLILSEERTRVDKDKQLCCSLEYAPLAIFPSLKTPTIFRSFSQGVSFIVGLLLHFQCLLQHAGFHQWEENGCSIIRNDSSVCNMIPICHNLRDRGMQYSMNKSFCPNLIFRSLDGLSITGLIQTKACNKEPWTRTLNFSLQEY